MKKMIIASTSTIHGGTYLSYILPELEAFFKDVATVLFVPYARPGGITHDEYTAIAAKGFGTINKKVVGLHTFENPVAAVENAEAIFVGGGNTFLLVSQLYRNKVMEVIRGVVNEGTPYFGTSAGSNITGLTMQTTNDMPIIYPPSFKTLGLVPFNINPHYIDADTQSKHMGETRETRIKEFHKINTQPVIGLREGSWLAVNGEEIVLKGDLSARIFEQTKEAYEISTGASLKF
ncbi:dipeptidase PepE [Neptunitalea lumnitzerae]|uniref:Dipeptidase E n=1 Tax=Neptunitalea lumnitzerae TaxID=2965509 RepID=A0ABQ5MMA9_9FLAO|nr:dipeptidase PepE [Neptunitalea sp. Y10]GLB50521.1 dipeptidase E [Neptunitalea sp. Y10]